MDSFYTTCTVRLFLTVVYSTVYDNGIDCVIFLIRLQTNKVRYCITLKVVYAVLTTVHTHGQQTAVVEWTEERGTRIHVTDLRGLYGVQNY